MTTGTLIVALLGLVGCLFFIVSFHIRTGGDWRSNEAGIWLMLSRINLGGIFALILSNRIFGDWAGRAELTLLLAALFAAQTFWPSKILWDSQDKFTHQGGKNNDSR